MVDKTLPFIHMENKMKRPGFWANVKKGAGWMTGALLALEIFSRVSYALSGSDEKKEEPKEEK